MGHTVTSGVILYCNPDQPYYTHRAHHSWFDEYSYCIYTEENRAPGYSLLQKGPESLIRNLYMLSLIPWEIVLTSTPFCDAKILTYEIE